MSRVLIVCVGNPLRSDDGFGPAVSARLGELPPGAEMVETGIGGVAFLQELMVGCDGLVVVDAMEGGARPGTVFVLEPEIAEAVHVPDVHLADPGRVLSIAQALGCLPERRLVVGCQPATQELGEQLSPAVEHAVPVAVEEVRATVAAWLGVGPGQARRSEEEDSG